MSPPASPPAPDVRHRRRRLARVTGCLAVAASTLAVAVAVAAADPAHREPPTTPWSLKPLAHVTVPPPPASSANPIDAFVAAACRSTRVTALAPADKLTWLRRVTLDLVGLPPTPDEQDAFLADPSETAADTVVDRLLGSEQHGVRYGRHWLDILRYSDVDEDMPAAPGIHFWRDWVVEAINRDLPYDQFVRAQILGNRATQRRIISAAGHLTPVDPRPEDLFALGFIARGAATRTDADQQLAFNAVETISSAFLGMTVGCARCHDHFYDPIRQADYYAFKAIFDPLVLRPVELATPVQIFEQGRKVEEHERRLNRAVTAMRAFIKPHHDRLYEERLASFPSDVQTAIRKPERERTAAEQAVYDDYYPILRIDPVKIKAVMSPDEIRQYDEYLKQIDQLKAPEPLPVFWTVAEDPKRAAETNYVLTTGDPRKPQKDHPVGPGFPFARTKPEFREGRRETLVDWLASPENPLFARVVVNRIWAWHFGSGLHASVSDFGKLGGNPVHPELLDYLAAELVAHGFSMKWLHRLIVTSETYRRASTGPAELVAANTKADPENRALWRFPLRRLEAEPIRDALLAAAGTLDPRLGGASFDGTKPGPDSNRRAAYMSRGYRASAELMPDYLQTFDAEDGRAVCPRRTTTITAPQALFLMNSDFAETATHAFAALLRQASADELPKLVRLGFQRALGRLPNDAERGRALDFLAGDAQRAAGLAWLLFNLDEFVYVR